jgi:zinc protease
MIFLKLINMKPTATLILTLFIGLNTSFGQTPTTTSFDAGGIKVIFKPTTKKVIDVRMYFRGGVTNFTVDKAGIERFALVGATECGSQQYTTNAVKDTCDKYGMSLSGGSTFDYGYIELNCVSKYLDKGWPLFVDAIMAPVFDANQVKLLRNKIIAADKNVAGTPVVSAIKPLVLSAFKGTAYSFDPDGTEETLNNITPADLKAYYTSQLDKQRIFMVVVGDITKDELMERILKAFSSIPSRRYTKPELEAPTWNDNKMMTEQRNIPAAYLAAVANSPLPNSHDYIPFKLGVAAIAGNLYYNLTVQQQTAFNPVVASIDTQMPYTYIAMATSRPTIAINEVFTTIKMVQKRGVNDEWLTRLKNGMVISNFMNEQNVAAVATKLGNAEINSDWHYADDYPQLIYMATVQQVNDALNKYIVGMKWNYVGRLEDIKDFTLPLF